MKRFLKVVIPTLIIAGVIVCVYLTGFSVERSIAIYHDVAITDKVIPESSGVKYGDCVDLIRAKNDLQAGDIVMSISRLCGTDVAVVKEVNEYEAFTEVTLLGSEEHPEDQIVNLKDTPLYRLTRFGDWSILGHWYVFILALVASGALIVLAVWWFDEGIYGM